MFKYCQFGKGIREGQPNSKVWVCHKDVEMTAAAFCEAGPDTGASLREGNTCSLTLAKAPWPAMELFGTRPTV